MTNKQWIVDEWKGCYPSNWKGTVVAEAMTHPAKFSSRLIRRIYEHITAEGSVKAGDGVLDPFGGVGLGALDAMRLGLHWTGVELEEKFWKIGNANLEKWTREFGKMPRWGTARLLHGDSRNLVGLVEGARLKVEGSISSPPYAEAIKNSENGSGIDYSKAKDGGKNRTVGRENIALGYGKSMGQLGAMKADEASYQLAVASPPFLQSEGGTPETKPGGVIDKRLQARHAAGNASAHGYGRTEGQLSSMNGDGFEQAVGGEPVSRATVSSPPYENSFDQEPEPREKTIERMTRNGHDISRVGKFYSDTLGYGRSEGQLGNDSGDDFWMAARRIVEQVYEALEPGGHASWVVKDYVKNKQVVPFADQWRQLCEAVGFVTVHEHRAMLVHHKGRQGKLEGGVHEIRTESKSFFRRLAEKKGSPRIDWEVVWCMEKP